MVPCYQVGNVHVTGQSHLQSEVAFSFTLRAPIIVTTTQEKCLERNISNQFVPQKGSCCVST